MKKPNIIFVLTDQWRAQAFGYSGDPNVKTPNIDSLAEKSLNFTNAISVCPVCTPHRASLLTGRFPSSTGMFMNDLYLPKEELCMADILKKAGYETAYIGKWHLDGHGRDSYIPPERRQGFDYWEVLECTHDYNESYYYDGNDPVKRKWQGYDAYAQTKDAQNYINEHSQSEKPFLLLIGFGGPHFPHHNAPEELKALYPTEKIEVRPNVPEDAAEHSRKELQGYYAHCTAIDSCIGELSKTIEESGIAEDTIFVFTSDHGDMHGSQGKSSWRKQLPWDESVCVPFLFRFPAIQAEGRKITTPINTPDILPSLLSLADITIPESVEGEDLSNIFKDSEEDKDRAALFMAIAPFGRNDFHAFRGIRTSQYTYVRDSEGPWLLYDNLNDPYQMKNLIDDSAYTEIKDKLEKELQVKLENNNDRVMSTEDALKKWGYNVGKGGAIPYRGEFKVQSPGPDKGEICSF